MKLVLPFAVLALCVSAPAQQAPASPNDPSTIRSTSNEVLLDVIVRDKKGRLIRDLTPKDFEVTDDGQPVKIKAFRFASGPEAAAPAAPASPAASARSGSPAVSQADPLRNVRIVTLVFDRLGDNARANARSAVRDLLKNEAGPNLFFAVFSIDQRLSVLQQYTTDKDRIEKAVTKVTSSASSLYKSESDQIEEELKTQATQSAAAAVNVPANSAPNGGSLASAALAQLTLQMMQFSQTMDRTLQGRSTLFALKSLITQQYRLPGRKTVLFFTEGLYIPPDYLEEFQALISDANRANVSVYGIDARGLATSSQNALAGSLLDQASSSSRTAQLNRGVGPVTRDQATALDRGDEAIRANSQNSLDELSSKTGGFMIANTNDLRPSLRRISEDVDTHYELAYSPDIRSFDGHFRKIAVRVDRPEVRIQTRAGYYALPFVQGQSLLPYELPMLNALTAAPLPRNIPFHSAGLHFKAPTGESEGAVVIDVPLEGIDFTRDEVNKVYQTHFSVLALFKDQTGAVVRKFSQDIPRQGPLDRIDQFKAGHFIYTQHAILPPGRYTLETAVVDRKENKVAARKASVLIPSGAAPIGISSLARVRSVTPPEPGINLNPTGPDADPFQVGTGKVTPSLDETAKAGPGNVLSYFFTIYADPKGPAPTLTIQFLQDGEMIGQGSPALSAPDANGHIPYIANTPLDSFKPGQYEMRVTAAQNGKAASERTVFTIE